MTGTELTVGAVNTSWGADIKKGEGEQPTLNEKREEPKENEFENKRLLACSNSCSNTDLTKTQGKDSIIQPTLNEKREELKENEYENKTLLAC